MSFECDGPAAAAHTCLSLRGDKSLPEDMEFFHLDGHPHKALVTLQFQDSEWEMIYKGLESASWRFADFHPKASSVQKKSACGRNSLFANAPEVRRCDYRIAGVVC